MLANQALGSTELRWRFPAQSLENAIELGQRLKTCGERNFNGSEIVVANFSPDLGRNS
jgi:hypothetical protein